MTSIILDTETTRADEQCEVISLAWQRYGSRDPADSFEGFYEPKGEIQWGAIAVHHHLPSEIFGQGYPSSSLAHLDLPKPLTYLIGHNIDFDWRALGQPPVKRICTLAMSRALWPELDSHSLGAVFYFLFGATEESRNRLRGAHHAYADVMLCYDVLEKITAIAKIGTMEELYKFSEDSRIPRAMTFGKHKGKRIEEVDRGYSNWYRKQPDPDPYLLEAFRRAGI